VLTERKNALVIQFQTLFSLDGVKLTFTDSAITAIAEKARDLKTGARGLRSIVENILLDVMFEMPLMESLDEVVISDEVVKSSTKPLLIHAERESDAGVAS